VGNVRRVLLQTGHLKQPVHQDVPGERVGREEERERERERESGIRVFGLLIISLRESSSKFSSSPPLHVLPLKLLN
jgi:hypothetical protein